MRSQPSSFTYPSKPLSDISRITSLSTGDPKVCVPAYQIPCFFKMEYDTTFCFSKSVAHLCDTVSIVWCHEASDFPLPIYITPGDRLLSGSIILVETSWDPFLGLVGWELVLRVNFLYWTGNPRFSPPSSSCEQSVTSLQNQFRVGFDPTECCFSRVVLATGCAFELRHMTFHTRELPKPQLVIHLRRLSIPLVPFSFIVSKQCWRIPPRLV